MIGARSLGSSRGFNAEATPFTAGWLTTPLAEDVYHPGLFVSVAELWPTVCAGWTIRGPLRAAWVAACLAGEVDHAVLLVPGAVLGQELFDLAGRGSGDAFGKVAVDRLDRAPRLWERRRRRRRRQNGIYISQTGSPFCLST